MPERTSYAPGTPSWVDIGVPDLDAAKAFYGAIFGWEAAPDTRTEAGGYTMMTLGGKNVAGIGPQQSPDMPPFWSVYVTVTDCDATAQTAVDNGGSIVVPGMDIFDSGRMAVLTDSTGSFISLWQPNQHIGCDVVNDPGTFVWNELATPSLDGTNAFYQAVFGWGLDPESSSGTSSIFTLDGEVICGAHVAGPGEPPFWSVWFAVTDTDGTAAQVAELGGTVVMPPNDMSFGRGAVVMDPAGAAFGIGTMNATS